MCLCFDVYCVRVWNVMAKPTMKSVNFFLFSLKNIILKRNKIESETQICAGCWRSSPSRQWLSKVSLACEKFQTKSLYVIHVSNDIHLTSMTNRHQFNALGLALSGSVRCQTWHRNSFIYFFGRSSAPTVFSSIGLADGNRWRSRNETQHNLRHKRRISIMQQPKVADKLHAISP